MISRSLSGDVFFDRRDLTSRTIDNNISITIPAVTMPTIHTTNSSGNGIIGLNVVYSLHCCCSVFVDLSIEAKCRLCLDNIEVQT